MVQHIDPHIDILTLQRTHTMSLFGVEVTEFATMHHDEVGLVESKLDLHADERSEGGLVVGCLRHAGSPRLEQPFTHIGQHGGQQRLLALEVVIDGRTTDADGGTEIVDAGGSVAAIGEQTRRFVQDLLCTCRHVLTLVATSPTATP